MAQTAPDPPSTQAPDPPQAPGSLSTEAPDPPSTQASDPPSTQAPDPPSTQAPDPPSIHIQEKANEPFLKQELDLTKGQNEYGGRFKAIIIFGVLVIVLAIIAPLLPAYYRQYFGTQDRLRVFDYNNSFAQVKAAFPGQTPRFWRILRNRATAHLKNPNPKKPLVIMFTAGPSAHNVLECIARKLAQSLEPEDNGLGYINSTDYHQHSSLDDAKKILDEKLEELLQKGRTLLIFNVDKLPVQSPLLFYEYCDNENAPYKRAAIIFTVRLPLEPDPSLEPAKAEGLVAKYLEETWGKQDYSRPDDIPPLVSRMTDTVVMVKEEGDETMKKNCAT